jgi:hypothetical protein
VPGHHTTGITKTTIKLAETITKYTGTLAQSAEPMNYRDTLTWPSTQNRTGTPYTPITLNPKTRAHKGIKSRQVLIDINPKVSTTEIKNETTAMIKEKAKNVSKECGGELLEHKIKAITHLKNSGILMALDSNKAAQ